MSLITLISLDSATDLDIKSLLAKGVGEKAVFETLPTDAMALSVIERARNSAKPFIADTSACDSKQIQELAVGSDLVLLAMHESTTGLGAISRMSFCLNGMVGKVRLVLGGTESANRSKVADSALALFGIATLFAVPVAGVRSEAGHNPNSLLASIEAPCNAASRRLVERITAKASEPDPGIEKSIRLRFAATAARSKTALEAARKKNPGTGSNEAEQPAQESDTTTAEDSHTKLAEFFAGLVLSQLPS